MSIADTIIEKYKSGSSKEGSVADRILARFGIEDKAKKKKRIVEENLALAEKYKAEAHGGALNTVNDFFGYGADKTGFAESQAANLVTENLKETSKDLFLQNDVDKGKIEQINRNSSLISEVLKKKRENPSKSALYDSVLKDLQSQNAELSGSVGGELKNKTDEQLRGQTIGTIAEASQAFPLGSLLAQGTSLVGKEGILQGAKLLSKQGAINIVKNPTFQEGVIYGGAMGASSALKEKKGALGVSKDTAVGAVTAGLASLGIMKGMSAVSSTIGKGLTKLFEKIGTRPKAELNPAEVKSTVDEIVGIVDRDLNPEEEQAVMEALSKGATKEEVVTEVGKAKVEQGLEPKARLSQVVDELEAGGKKLSLDEIATVKKGMDEGKSFEEIQSTLEPQKAPSTAPNEETGATVPKDTYDNGDEAFLKAVEERFKASKTNKFREAMPTGRQATKDEKGRFTGSKSEARMKTGDPERDALSESIQTRIDNLGKDELNKTTQSNFDDTSQRLKLEEIQNQIPKAKVEELPRLKEESDRIIKEILDKRAVEFKATSKKEDLIQKARTIANNSNSSLEFRVNLRKEGLGKAFKSQQSEEEFYRRMNGAKYRLADEDPLIQEAKKYKSAEEFVSSQDNTWENFMKKETSKSGKLIFGKEEYGKFLDSKKGIVVEQNDPILKNFDFSSYEGRETLSALKHYNNYVRQGRNDTTALAMIENAYNSSIKDNIETITRAKQESQLTDIWKKAHGEKFRDIAPRFEELTGTKITPEQEAQIKSLHKRMFGDENVEITAQILTPEGQKAFGVYQNKVIKILDGQVDPTDTFYHEAVHKYLDLFTTMDEQKSIYLEARKLWKTDNLDELEEKIAENFIRYAKENEGVVGTMKVLFDKVIDRIKTALKGESSIEALYKDILEGKAKNRGQKVKVSKGKEPVTKQDVPKGKKVSIIASRLNKDLPPDFRIDETYDPKAINKEADRAAELIAENKTKAIQKALDTGTNPMERDAILIELSEIAKRDKDYGTLNDLFNKRSELIRSGAQSLNMEKASILLNPQEQYMRNVVNAKLGKVKISGKDLTPETLAAKRTGIRKETKDAVRKSFKIEDAQELFDKLLCK